jgi:hypothetical protein
MTLKASVEKLKDVRQRFGLGAAVQYFLHRLVNQVIYFERLNVIVLDRDRLKPLKPSAAAQLSSRLATLQDLEALRPHPIWEIDGEKMDFFHAGDSCLLSYAGEKLAGYTWAHTLGRPEILPGLIISVPDQYLYNYAGLTLPEFRGLGMQPYRHHALLNHEKWQGKKGLLGYVKYMNFSSRHGQEKSGYRTIGSIWMFGSATNFKVYVSSSLRSIGVKRLQPLEPRTREQFQ